MSEYYPRSDSRTREEVLADEEACLANFDRLQRFFVLGRFINRDAFLPRRHRALFASAVALLGFGASLGIVALVYSAGDFRHPSPRDGGSLLLLGLAMSCLIFLMTALLFPFRKWNGKAALAGPFGDRVLPRRLIVLLSALAVYILVLRALPAPFAWSELPLAAPLSLAVAYGISLWRTPKFVEPGFEERWIAANFGKQKTCANARRSS
ncbi:MAG: hypothetical protein ACYC96_00815 [Fimbriimonadaceae bacterium]